MRLFKLIIILTALIVVKVSVAEVLPVHNAGKTYLSVSCNERGACWMEAIAYCHDRGAGGVRATEPEYQRGSVHELRFWCTQKSN